MPENKRVELTFDIVTKHAGFATLVVPESTTDDDIKELLLEHISTVGIRDAGKPEHRNQIADDVIIQKWEHFQAGHHAVEALTVTDYNEEIHTQPPPPGAVDMTN